MPNEVLRKNGDPILFAHSTVSPVLASNYTRFDFDPAECANNAGKQSAKADLGARRAPAYDVIARIQFGTAPTAGAPIEFYWAPSPSATPGSANPGGVSGEVGDYSGGTGGTLSTGVAQLDFIGAFSPMAIATEPQTAKIGTLSPSQRFGTLVMRNTCGQTLSATKTAMEVLLSPVIDEVQ